MHDRKIIGFGNIKMISLHRHNVSLFKNLLMTWYDGDLFCYLLGEILDMCSMSVNMTWIICECARRFFLPFPHADICSSLMAFACIFIFEWVRLRPCDHVYSFICVPAHVFLSVCMGVPCIETLWAFCWVQQHPQRAITARQMQLHTAERILSNLKLFLSQSLDRCLNCTESLSSRLSEGTFRAAWKWGKAMGNRTVPRLNIYMHTDVFSNGASFAHFTFY